MASLQRVEKVEDGKRGIDKMLRRKEEGTSLLHDSRTGANLVERFRDIKSQHSRGVLRPDDIGQRVLYHPLRIARAILFPPSVHL